MEKGKDETYKDPKSQVIGFGNTDLNGKDLALPLHLLCLLYGA